MNVKYINLFSPLRLGDVMLKNRIISSPAGVPQAKTPSSTHYGSISAYDRSLGGAGLVIDPIYGCGLEQDPFSKYGADSTREILSVLKQSGGMASYAVGAYAMKKEADGKVISLYPSDGIECFPMGGRKASIEELQDYIKEQAVVAKKTKDFGFDLVMLMMADSTTTSLMLSSWNTRTDIYGGTLENRCRWSVEFAKAMREAVGPDYPLLARIPRTLGPVPQSHSEDDSIYLCKQLAKYVNGFIVYNGMDTYGVTIDKYETNVHQQTTIFEPMSYNLAYSARLKKEVGLPVFINCGIGGDPSVPEKWIADGFIDGISMARQLFADPFWPKKAEEGRDDDIVPCLRCNYCYHISTVHDNVQCSVNPRFRRENRVPLEIQKTNHVKNVVVIGGGPAGMKAALVASEKGHTVTLIEKSDRLGGLLNVSDHGGYKKELRDYRDYLIKQIKKSNIIVMMKTEATNDFVKNLKPEGLIIAVGGEPIMPNIPGVEFAEKVVDAYVHFDQIQGKVVVIGGGAIGSEVGLEMAENGRDVTVVEMTDTLSAKENWLYRIAQRQHIANCSNFKAKLEFRVIEIRSDGVTVIDKNGEKEFIEADHILMSVGMKSKKNEAFKFYNITPNTTMIGDCRKVGHVLDCTNDAYFVAVNI